MTTATQSHSRGRFARPALPVIIGGILIIAIIGTLVARSTFLKAVDPLHGGTTATVEQGSLVAGINATGIIEPRVSADLSFPVNVGLISTVLVEEGDSVAQGDALIQLDDRQIRAAAAAAEANLAQAQADLQGLKDGATAEEIAAARAQVAAAQGTLRETQGRVTGEDTQAAQRAVEEARARLAKLEAGPKSEDVARAQAALDQARANLEQQRSTLASAKEAARTAIEARANALREAQLAYSTAYWDLHYVAGSGQDPRELEDLTDAETRDFVAALDKAQLELNNAEKALAQANVDYETARQQEIAGLAASEAQVAAAQADLDDLLKGADADELAAARAQLAQAQADLAKLHGAERQGAVEAEWARLSNAQAQLDQLLADPQASDLARAEAVVAQARAQLDRARTDLDITTMRAPFDGVIAQVHVAPGEAVSPQPALTLVDTSRYKVVVKVDEVDVARVAVGQPVDVLIDALGEPPLQGTVRIIAPQSIPGETVTSYAVTIQIDPGDHPVKSGMTASATIVTERREAALSVPVQAVRTENGLTMVDVMATGSAGEVQVTPQAVETGLQVGDRIEIRSGLSLGQQVLLPAPTE